MSQRQPRDVAEYVPDSDLCDEAGEPEIAAPAEPRQFRLGPLCDEADPTLG